MSAFSENLQKSFEQNGLLQFISFSEKLEIFYNFLCEENEKYNLTAITGPDKAAVLHFADSLLVSEYIPQGASVIDIGCGAGFPSLPLAVCRPDITVTALDSAGKKIAFVKKAAELCGADNITAVCCRAEDFYKDEDNRERFDIAVARGVAPAPVLCEISFPAVKKGGALLEMKGDRGAEEIKTVYNCALTLGGDEAELIEYTLRGKDEEYGRSIIFIDKISETDKKYPRPYAKIIKKPL